MAAEVGQPAPDFTLKDQNNQEVRLSDFRGKNVVLLFYPLSFSGICTNEMCAVQEDLGTFQNDDVQVLGISVDTTYTHRVFAEQKGLQFPLLADFWPHGKVADEYGVFDAERGVALRGTIVVDKEGVVRWKRVNAIPDARDHAEYAKVLAELS